MSGHNKLSQIKRQKGVTDAKRSQAFAKVAKIIAIAARKGPDLNANFELRAAVEKAKAINMPADNIERAIKKGSGTDEGAQMEFVRYEAYGPGGAAIIIEALTDSKNRTVAEIKHLLSEHGAKWAEQGSVIWAFEASPAGQEPKWSPKITVKLSPEDEEKLMKIMEVLDDHDDVQEVFCNAE